MINISEKYYKLTTLLIMLCFVVTSCKKNVQSSQGGWTCTCGTVNTGNFCGNCGSAKPVWTCSCGTENTTNFCGNCGKQKGEQKEQKEQKKQKVQQEQAINSNPFKNAKVGDYVKFGNYPQTAEDDEEQQPIEWQILAKGNNKMLVISRYGLDCKRFDDDSNDWENSGIRQWLNGYFYNKAFNENEKKLINPSNLSDVGTIDNVFLLSKEDAEIYFANDDERRCKVTEYAVKNGASTYYDRCCYWLRSLEPNRSNYVYCVGCNGRIFPDRVDGDYYVAHYYVARPALWIKLDFEHKNLDLKSDSLSQVLNYNNKKEKQNSVKSNLFTSANLGDYVKFGNYPQTAEGEEQPIEWQVLAKENSKMLVISRYGLDAKRFDDDSNDWENSEIRSWLNGDFYNKAFNGKEKKLINHSNLSDVGTTDNVFLLSKDEAEKYFANAEARRCKATDYSVKRGAYVDDGSYGGEAGYSLCWLRSPSDGDYVYRVNIGGLIIDYVVYNDDVVARPALWINL